MKALSKDLWHLIVYALRLIHKVLPEPRGTMYVELSSPGPLSAQRMQRVVGALVLYCSGIQMGAAIQHRGISHGR